MADSIENPRPLTVVLLLGGEGLRFSSEGYLRPKVLVNLHGRPIVQWAIQLLNLRPSDHFIIAYHKRLDFWNFKHLIIHAFPKLKVTFVPIEFNTRGAVESALIAVRSIEPECTCPLVFLDGDSLHTEPVLDTARNFFYGTSNKRTTAHAVFYKTEKNLQPIFSFVRLDPEKAINGALAISTIVEKQAISEHYCIGIYGFSSISDFRALAIDVLDNGITARGEHYMSLVYTRALNKQYPVYGLECKSFVSVGTPLQVLSYLAKATQHSTNTLQFPTSLKGLRICFDLDNTLVTYPNVLGDYTTVEPIHHVIDTLRMMHRNGAIIIIHTARRMKTHNDNVGKVIKDQARIVLDTLDKFEIPYDELYFGKPLADFYIDDRAINPFIRMPEELGLPNPSSLLNELAPSTELSFVAVPPRSFHKIQVRGNRVEKIGHTAEMAGQRYYFEHIPSDLVGRFPQFLGASEEGPLTTLAMSRATGVTLSLVYVNGTLTPILFQEILDSLSDMHAWRPSASEATQYPTPSKTNLYMNWAPKMHQRWGSRYQDCYRLFPKSDLVVPRLIYWLEQYEYFNRGTAVPVIHGDSVFTNCIVRADRPRVCWVDMKGLLGTELHTGGDINYDWSKILQSILGYDYILLNKPNTALNDYPHLLHKFKAYYVTNHGPESWAWLCMLTAHFLIALLPNHLDTPVESQLFYKMGVKVMIEAEKMLAEHGRNYTKSGTQSTTLTEEFIFNNQILDAQ
jgi:capsule biosynthesis phosphatase